MAKATVIQFICLHSCTCMYTCRKNVIRLLNYKKGLEIKKALTIEIGPLRGYEYTIRLL
jgi:hypothetical protein